MSSEERTKKSTITTAVWGETVQYFTHGGGDVPVGLSPRDISAVQAHCVLTR